MKVVRSDATTGEVFARSVDGLISWFTVNSGDVPERGCVLLLGDTRFDRMPDELWTSPKSIGVVRRLLPDGELVVEDSLGLRLVRNEGGLPIALHNTVEFSDSDGIIRLVAAEPIRRDLGVGAEDDPKNYLIDRTAGGPTFEEFGGYPDVVERARELIDTQINCRDQLVRIGARPVKGILFTGPPGTGKTHLARIIANESEADFFLISGPSIVSKWVGDSEETLRKIFEAATSSSANRAIIFFDEIDSIAERRSGDTHEASRRLVAQFLTLMDGFDDKGSNIVVIAATNRPDALDPALTRPGRFDWEIEFAMPSLRDRFEILRVSARHLQAEDELPLEDVAVLTSGWSAADLSSIWTEAALIAAGDTRDRIGAEDLAQAFERIARRPRRHATGETQ